MSDPKRNQASKSPDPKRRALIDNPLLQSTLKPASQKVLPPAFEAKAAIRSSVKELKDTTRYIMSPEEEKVSVFEIISDLEKQLDASFSLKDAQEKEIQGLRERAQKAEEKAGIAEAKLKEMKGMLVSQEQLNSELEFLENERLDSVGKIKNAEEELEGKEAFIKDQDNKIAALDKELDGRDTRIEQIELELSSANKTIQSLHHQVALLEDEKDSVTEKFESMNAELSGVTVERDQARQELERAKESLDEIRLMLADTRARAREHYYKPKAK